MGDDAKFQPSWSLLLMVRRLRMLRRQWNITMERTVTGEMGKSLQQGGQGKFLQGGNTGAQSELLRFEPQD